MRSFFEWLGNYTLGTEQVDASQIESHYKDVKKSVMIVKLYDQMSGKRLLTDISTIASLSSGAYGLYLNSENHEAIPKDVWDRARLIYQNDPYVSQKLIKLTKKKLLELFPKANPNQIIPSSVIHVNVEKHVASYPNNPTAAIIEIASTIVHEATHVLEDQTTGHTEDGPNTPVEIAERDFKIWAKNNWPMLTRKFQLVGDFPF